MLHTNRLPPGSVTTARFAKAAIVARDTATTRKQGTETGNGDRKRKQETETGSAHENKQARTQADTQTHRQTGGKHENQYAHAHARTHAPLFFAFSIALSSPICGWPTPRPLTAQWPGTCSSTHAMYDLSSDLGRAWGCICGVGVNSGGVMWE